MKDYTVDRMGYRELLLESLDEIYSKKYPADHLLDSVESKLFGLGSELYVVGSHDFYLGYAVKNGLKPCLDLGHYHPTESVADKISAILPFVSGIMLRVSRGVKWDSDHVVTLDDHLFDLLHEIVRCDALDRIHIGLDYFDASINRIGAWVTGVRATQKALLIALLEPVEKLINILADTPEVVAEFLVEKARNVTGSGKSIMFLTNTKVIWRFMTGFQRKDRHIKE